jgi:uncharacterized protein YijF (DUF1287 family)
VKKPRKQGQKLHAVEHAGTPSPATGASNTRVRTAAARSATNSATKSAPPKKVPYRPTSPWALIARDVKGTRAQRRDAVLLALPFLICTLAITAMYATRDTVRLDPLIASRGDLNTQDGAPRALTGLPRALDRAVAVKTAPDTALAVKDDPAPAAEARVAPEAVASVAEEPKAAAPASPLAEQKLAAATPSELPPKDSQSTAKAAPAAPVPAASAANPAPPKEKIGLSASTQIAIAIPEPAKPLAPREPAAMPPVGPDKSLPVMSPPEYANQPIMTATQCLPAPEKLQPTILLNRRDAPATDPEAFGMELAQAAREQLQEFVIYNDRYTVMKYPMGDVRPMYGVCTDVVIRAYRAVGIDLQELIHRTRVGSGDTNIDHRRVDTMRKFFSIHGQSLPVSTFAEDYRPGDIVSYWRPQNRHSRTHIAIVSDRYAPSGRQ